MLKLWKPIIAEVDFVDIENSTSEVTTGNVIQSSHWRAPDLPIFYDEPIDY